MFEVQVVRREAPGSTGSAVAPASSGLSASAGSFERVDSLEAREALLERLGSMVPGGDLAMVLEEVVSHVLVPEEACGDGSGEVGPEDEAAVLLPGVLDPSERALGEAAGAWCLDGSDEGGAGTVVALGAEAVSELAAAASRLRAWAAWAEAVLAGLLVRTEEMAGRASGWERASARTGNPPEGSLKHPESLEGQAVLEDAVKDPAGPGVTERGYSHEGCVFNATGHLACRLGVSRSRAGQLIERGQAMLGGALARTECLHRVGLIDEAKVALVVRRLDGEEAETVLAVQERVLPRAPRRTHAQLAKDLDRALAALDPEGACERGRRNQAARHVGRPRAVGAGVSLMRLLLPTPDAFVLDATLDAIAASARAEGDERTLGQLRADALTSMTLSTLRRSQAAASAEVCASLAGAGAGESSVCGAADAEADPSVTDAQGAPRAAGTDSWALEGAGRPVLLADGVPLEGLLASLSSLVSTTGPWWSPSGHEPVLPPPGLTIRVDVTVPLDHLVDLLDGPGPTGRGSSGSWGPAPGTSASRGPAPGASAPERFGPGSQGATLTIGGRSTPVPAVVARALAAGGTWRRLVTDPLSGVVVDVGRRSYRPPAALADLVRARDVSCTHPGCEVPALRCDIDHIRPWAQGGATSLENLTCLCQAHHRLKHTPGWALTRTSEGSLTWRTPTGARYERLPDGSVHRLPQRVGPRGVTRPGGRVPAWLERALTAPVLARLDKGLQMSALSQDRDQNRVPKEGRPVLQSRGPRPGERAGDYEAMPYDQALHVLGLAPLLDEVPPF